LQLSRSMRFLLKKQTPQDINILTDKNFHYEVKSIEKILDLGIGIIYLNFTRWGICPGQCPFLYIPESYMFQYYYSVEPLSKDL
jgi:hypothetical protein